MSCRSDGWNVEELASVVLDSAEEYHRDRFAMLTNVAHDVLSAKGFFTLNSPIAERFMFSYRLTFLGSKHTIEVAGSNPWRRI